MKKARDANKYRTEWTKEEEQEFAGLYLRFSAPELAPKLNRTERALYCKAAELRLHKQRKVGRARVGVDDELRSPFVGREYKRCGGCGAKARMTEFGVCLGCAMREGLTAPAEER